MQLSLEWKKSGRSAAWSRTCLGRIAARSKSYFKLQDTKIKTIGLGKSDKASEGGTVEILVYPEGATAVQNSASSVSR